MIVNMSRDSINKKLMTITPEQKKVTIFMRRHVQCAPIMGACPFNLTHVCFYD